MARAARKVIDSRLRDIRGVVQANLFDSELGAARELLKSGYVRAAGVLAGVVLERHLADVATNHAVRIRRANPTVSHYNDGLKTAGVIDVPRWRSIQHLADIRNICAHNAGREPIAGEVRELIDGVDKVIKSIF